MPFPIAISTKADVDELVSSRRSEQRTLEYKAQLPSNSDTEVQEFLADVSSFANAAGGHLLYGVTAARDADGKATGEPEAARGLKDANVDAEKLRLEAILKDCVDQRIPSLSFEAIPGFVDGPVLVVSIPRSWLAPHLVKRQKSTRFYSRNSAGRYQMGMVEIRTAVLAAGGVEDRVRRFRDERIAAIRAGTTPVPLKDGPRLILHLIPMMTLDSPLIDLSKLHERAAGLKPIAGLSGFNSRYNLDGFVTSSGQEPSRSYLQVFRNGAFEFVDDYILRYNQTGTPRLISGLGVCDKVLDASKVALTYQKSLGVQPPLVVMLTLLNVKEMSVLGVDAYNDPGTKIDRDDLSLPDILLPTLEQPDHSPMKPIFDALFQAGGWPECPAYNEDGKWKYIRS